MAIRGFKRTLCFAVMTITLGGCGYGKVSPKTYEFAKALHTTCSRQSPEHLEKAADMIKESHKKGEISDKEAGWLNDIIADARAGNWKTATSQARRMMKDQVEGGP